MNVTRVNWAAPQERVITARFYSVSPRPKASEPEKEAPEEEHARAKVVRARRKGPRVSVEGVQTK